MNRKEEYEALLLELQQTPAELEHTVERAWKRKKAAGRTRRAWLASCGSIAACFTAFVLLVNLSVPFARACGNVPVLRELAKAVAWSPSLSAAVENDYVQPIGQTQTENGVSATVEYVIVDRKSLHVFYTLEFDDELGDVYADYDYGEIHGWSGDAGSARLESGELNELGIDFVEQDVPDTLELTLRVYARGGDDGAAPAEEIWDEDALFEAPAREAPDYLAELSFQLEFDPCFTAQGQILPIDAEFTLDGQSFTLTEAELYPTHLRLNLHADPDNTAWLAGLDLYLENEHGERFEQSLNGISATGDPDGEGFGTFWLDSPFFSRGQQLTLHITRAKWREKEGPETRLDLAAGTAEHLPEGVRFLGAERYPEGWVVSFAAPYDPVNTMYSPFGSTFRNEAGTTGSISQFSHTFGVEDPATGERTEEDTLFTEEFPLPDLEGTVVYLEPDFDRISNFAPAVAVSIR